MTMTKEKKFSLLPVENKAQLIYHCLEDNKARDITALEVKSAVTDVVLIASASSARHAKSLADNVILLAKKEKLEILSTEGYQAGAWVLVDLNDVVVHIFLEENRDLFQLESLWHEAEPLVLESRSRQSKK